MDEARGKQRLSRKNKIAASFIVCVLFIIIAVYCFNSEKKTYRYDIDLTTLEQAGKDTDLATEPFLNSSFFVLPVGRYLTEITYSANADCSVFVQGNNDCVFSIALPATGGEIQTVSDESLILPCGTDKGKLQFYDPEGSGLSVESIRISSFTHIYTDYYAYLVLALLIALGLIALILISDKLKITKEQSIYVLLMLFVLILINIPYFTKGLYFEIDTQGHLKRIEAIVQGLRDGQLPVLIGPNYANQYGELVALQPNLFLYIPAFLRRLNVSITASYHIYLILVNIATAFIATLCAERMFGSLRWALVAGIVYLLEPFRMYMMLELGAGAGTGTALIFLPLLITGMHETMRRNGRKWKYIAFGLWGIACSHVLSFALASLLLLAYILIHIRKMNLKVFLSLVKVALLFLALSVGILLPFAYFYMQDWNTSALQWSDFYHYPLKWKKELQHAIALVILVVSYIGVRKTATLSKFGRGIFAIGILNTLISFSYFPWTIVQGIPLFDMFLSMLQYPSRFHYLAVPAVALVAAEAICTNLDAKNASGRVIIAVITAVLLIGAGVNMYRYYAGGKLFTDTQTGYINTVMEDYLPAGTESEWYASDAGDFSDYDLVEASDYSKVYTKIDCTYTSRAEGQYMEFPLFYYEGYRAVNESGQPLIVENGEHNRVRVYLEEGEDHEIHLHYEVRRLYTALFLFSVFFCALDLLYEGIRFIFKIKRSKRII